MLVETPYPESQLAFSRMLLSSFGELRTQDPLHLESVSSHNRPQDLGRISIPPEHLPSLAPIYNTSLPRASAQLHPWLLFLAFAFFDEAYCTSLCPPFDSVSMSFILSQLRPSWSSTLALPLFPALLCPLSGTQPSPTYPPLTKPTFHLFLHWSLSSCLPISNMNSCLLSSHPCWFSSPTTLSDGQRVTKSQAEVPAKLRDHPSFKNM